MKRLDRDKLITAVGAPVLAVFAALVLTSLIILISGKDPFRAYQVMIEFGTTDRSAIYIVNKSTMFFLSALAVAIGFRMNLFNIGVDGQYRIAAFFAAAVGGAVSLPGILQIPLIILVAMGVGAIWAGIAGVLRTTRGVSEVITTIMLNSIAGAVIGYYLTAGRLGEKDGNLTHTPDLPDSGHIFMFGTSVGDINGFVVFAVLAGFLYWFVLNRTRFGFDLRSVGQSETAAAASGVDVKRMIVTSMVLSGAVAGLVGMPTLLGESYNYGTDFPLGVGFTGIAIALLGRNHPVGIALGALLWAFLERTGTQLEFEGYDQKIVEVIKGIIVLCVVIAYEVVRRWALRDQQRRVGEELAQARTNDKAEVGA